MRSKINTKQVKHLLYHFKFSIFVGLLLIPVFFVAFTVGYTALDTTIVKPNQSEEFIGSISLGNQSSSLDITCDTGGILVYFDGLDCRYKYELNLSEPTDEYLFDVYLDHETSSTFKKYDLGYPLREKGTLYIPNSPGWYELSIYPNKDFPENNPYINESRSLRIDFKDHRWNFRAYSPAELNKRTYNGAILILNLLIAVSLLIKFLNILKSDLESYRRLVDHEKDPRMELNSLNN